MASDVGNVALATRDSVEKTFQDGDTSIEYETLSAHNGTRKNLDGVQHRILTLEAMAAGNDVIGDEGHEQNSDARNGESDCGIGMQSEFHKDACGLPCSTAKPTEKQIKSEPLEKDIVVVDCDEISTTVKSECSDVSKSESKRHNVFKSIIDRLTRKEVGLMESQTKITLPVSDSQCSGSTAASTPPRHPLPATLSPSANPHLSTSPGILFTNALSSSSSSACSSSSSALNLSFLFRGFPGYEDSGTASLNSEQGVSKDLPSEVPYPVAKFQGSLTNWRSPAGKKDDLEKVGLHSDEAFLDDAEIFRNKMEMLDCMLHPDPNESHPGMIHDQSVVCLDLDNEEAAASRETWRLDAIKHRYHKSLDCLRKVRVISATLEKERETLRLKRQGLQRALHKLRFLYNVTRLRYAKGRTLDRQTISSLWNLAKFEEASTAKQDEDGQDDGKWHGIDSRLETGSDQGSSPRSSPANFSKKQKTERNKDDAMQIDCDDDVTTTSCPLNYSLKEVDGRTRGSQCIASRRDQEPMTGNFPSAFRRANPVEREAPRDQFPRRHHLPLIADGSAAWRYINSAEEQSEEQQTIDGFANTNNAPAHSASYSRSNRQDNRKRMRGGGGGKEEGFAAVNHHRAHVTSNRLEVNVGKTPAAAHEMKRDLNNFTYLYCSQDRN